MSDHDLVIRGGRVVTASDTMDCDVAVRDGRVLLVDGNQYFNRPGPRLVESLQLLAEMLHPEEFGTRHRGIAWEPLP